MSPSETKRRPKRFSSNFTSSACHSIADVIGIPQGPRGGRASEREEGRGKGEREMYKWYAEREGEGKREIQGMEGRKR